MHGGIGVLPSRLCFFRWSSMIKTSGISLSCGLRPRISEFLPNDAAATAGSKCPLWGWSQLTEITQAPRSPVNPKAERRLTVYRNIILFLYHLAFWQNEPKCGQRRKHQRAPARF